MDELFSNLKAFEDYAIPYAQPKESNDDENLTDDHLPDFVKASPYFWFYKRLIQLFIEFLFIKVCSISRSNFWLIIQGTLFYR